MVKVLSKINNISNRVHTTLAIIAGCIALGMMAMSIGDITGRYLFAKPLQGAYEINELGMAFLIFLSITYTQIQRGHVSVTILTGRFHPQIRNWLEIFGSVCGFLVFCLIAWQSFSKAMFSWEIQEVYPHIPIFIYPARFMLFIGCAFISIQFLLDIPSILAKTSQPALRTASDNKERYKESK